MTHHINKKPRKWSFLLCGLKQVLGSTCGGLERRNEISLAKEINEAVLDIIFL